MTTTSSELRGLYPSLEPYATGMLAVGDGNHVYWEESGNPDGKPALFLHGGPGGGSGTLGRRFFDPERYRIIVLDQRNCGRSTPHASEPDADLATNTTWHLVADLELLRADRGVDSWLVFGGSWGSALALAYAEAHPEAVSELVLRGIFTLRRSELDWYYNGGAGNLEPEWWGRFLAPLGPDAAGDTIAAYHDLLWHADKAVSDAAGVAWTTWEAATTRLHRSEEAIAEMGEPAYASAFARIENHYFVNAGWLREGQLLADVDRIRHIPCVIVQGHYDLACPAVTAWDLHRAWPEAEFHLVHAGHSATEPEILDRLIGATDAFAAGAVGRPS